MEKNSVTLSVAIAVYNEEKNLRRCLFSIKDIADEIVLVDGGSTDKTLEIAREFNAIIILTDNPAIFHINKQKALDACKGDWILQLDADEVIPSDLKAEIGNSLNSGSAQFNGYYIARRNYFWGHFMKKGGVYPDAVIRLVKNGFAKFPCVHVHEQIEIHGAVGYLSLPMEHYSYQTRKDYWNKADLYTSLTAKELEMTHGHSIVSKIKLFFLYSVIKPIIAFLSIYVRHKGFLDGLTGFEFALYSAVHFPWAYLKYCIL